MLIYPAIDLVDGEVVRLFQGDYNQKTVYGTSPLAFVQQFYDQGARYLHVVDLDGAKAGEPKNLETIQEIAQAFPDLTIEVGGGIRTEDTIKTYLTCGVKRIILGTAALKSQEFLQDMTDKYGEAIVVGVDARDGKVAVEGWLETSDRDSFAFCEKIQEIGVKSVIYTDISKDGAGNGTNLEIYQKLKTLNQLHITASGGISSMDDITRLQEIGVFAAILGKSLYTNQLNLKDVLLVAGSQE